MNSIRNTVQLMGHLGKDLELLTFENGNSIVKGTLATNDYYINNKGEKIEDTQWHNIIAWGKLAQSMSQILRKGNEVTVKGKLTHRSYQDKTGVKRYVTEIVVSEFVKVTRKEAAI
ncbi:MAG: single-stranded DNA-binding protein [Saprospiraceae bacterium]|nr:single-stranded DNA-binding protein [Saprospiraceae bacterium]